ncbi:MAG: trypco2 family protein [Pseudomonadota bacterium]
MSKSTGLKDLIYQVRQDLMDIQNTARGGGRLVVKELMFELQMVAVEKEDGKGGIDLKLIMVDGDLDREQTQIHKVTVKVEVEEFQGFPQTGIDPTDEA